MNLKPRVRCMLQPANHGAGVPDSGLFTQEWFRRGGLSCGTRAGRVPSRGAIEVKGPVDKVQAMIESKTVMTSKMSPGFNRG
jgi:hypothetical protein